MSTLVCWQNPSDNAETLPLHDGTPTENREPALENPVKDYSQCQSFYGAPRVGDKIAYKVLHLSIVEFWRAQHFSRILRMARVLTYNVFSCRF